MASLISSSHLNRYSSVNPRYFRLANRSWSTQSLFEIHLKGLSKCCPHPGLTIMGEYFYRNSLKKIPEHSQKTFKNNKLVQFNTFSKDLSSGDEIATLVVGLSNDYKTFLSIEGKMIPLTRKAKSHFDKLTKKEKATYDVLTHRPLLKTSKIHLESKFQAYENILTPILAKSNLEYFYHCSIFERINPRVANLPMYFAILNSFLKRKLNYWSRNETFKNRNGKPIKCIFVDVREQFFLAENPHKLFVDREVISGGELVHRQDWALDELVRDLKKVLSPHIPPN